VYYELAALPRQYIGTTYILFYMREPQKNPTIEDGERQVRIGLRK
jgi:hypothetical protein